MAERTLLPKERITLKLSEDKTCVIAGIYEYAGYMDYEKYRFSDLPNDLVSIDDLKRFGINIVHRETGAGD